MECLAKIVWVDKQDAVKCVNGGLMN